MGIQDREYYRAKTRGSAWFSGAAPVCRAIILINVALFILDKFIGGHGLTDFLGATSAQIFEKFQIWRLITAAFVHDPTFVLHIVGNMLFLWMVGREMESFYGSRDFLALYLSAAFFSTLTWAAVDYFGTGHGHEFGAAVMIGASGAVMAVVVLYTLYYPTREVIFFFFPIEMRWLLALYLGYDILQFVTGSQSRVAFAAHLGGALYGYLFKVGDLRLSRLLKLVGRRKPRLRVFSADPPTREVKSSPRPAPPPVTTSGTPPPSSPGPSWTSSSAAPSPARHSPTIVTQEQLDARLDEILVKIAREGRDGLTDDEKRILEEASRRARHRRSERI